MPPLHRENLISYKEEVRKSAREDGKDCLVHCFPHFCSATPGVRNKDTCMIKKNTLIVISNVTFYSLNKMNIKIGAF